MAREFFESFLKVGYTIGSMGVKLKYPTCPEVLRWNLQGVPWVVKSVSEFNGPLGIVKGPNWQNYKNEDQWEYSAYFRDQYP